MSRAESIEALAGIVLLAAGASSYFGWADVAIGLGALLLLGALLPAAWRRSRGVP